MPRFVKALIVCLSVLVLEGLLVFLALPALLDLSTGQATVLGLVCMLFGGIYSFVMVWLAIYETTLKSLWCLLLDVTWSLPNTMVGLLWLAYGLISTGQWQTPNEETQRRGVMHLRNVALGDADATTLGNVIGGDWLIHETVHVQQARILGLFYWPAYLLSFTFAFVIRLIAIPVWKIFGQLQSGDGGMMRMHDHAYRRTVMEDWAYRSTPANSATIHWGAWTLWFLVGLSYGGLVAITIAPIPFLGALPDLLGLDVVPWWVGLFGLVAYAIVRSFFRGSEEHGHFAAAAPPTSDEVWA